jgi:capsular polysaccharide transport system permease protein
MPDQKNPPVKKPHAAAAQPKKPIEQAAYKPRPPVKPARAKARHWGLLIAFLVIVILPVAGSSWYLYTRAADQYASTLGFTVRSEDVSSSLDLLSGLGSSLGSSGGRDSDILYEFISSQELVRAINAKMDLRRIFSRHYDTDPLLSFNTDGTIENLTAFWQRMVRVSYDSGSGLIELRTLAFSADEAQQIAWLIYDESSEMINELSAIARSDATRYAQEELTLALERLKLAREAMTTFRLANQIVDPNADIQVQMGLLKTLQTQQVSALIEHDLISETASPNDPRVTQARRRLEVIEALIENERQKFGTGGSGPRGQQFARTIAEFERLSVDREYAEATYATALNALDAARAEANRQSRYLAAYIKPTLAEKPEFPQRELIVAFVLLFSFLVWAICSLLFYALRDRD